MTAPGVGWGWVEAGLVELPGPHCLGHFVVDFEDDAIGAVVNSHRIKKTVILVPTGGPVCSPGLRKYLLKLVHHRVCFKKSSLKRFRFLNGTFFPEST